MVHIKDIDNLPPTEYQKELIAKCRCLNCGEEYNPDREIVFYEGKTRMLFWHKNFCK